MPASTSRWPLAKIVVHRAGGIHAPENTAAAIKTAARMRCRAVEFDVQNTADGGLFLCHDEFLGRVVKGAGRLCELTTDQAKRLRVENPREPGAPAEPLCSFEEAAALCSELHLAMNIELKPARGCEEVLADLAARALDFKRLAVPVLVSSFHAGCLARFHRQQSAVPCGFLFEEASVDWQKAAREIGVVAVHPHHALATESMVHTAHAAGWAVMAWTVDDAALARTLTELGVEALCTNRPEILQKALAG